MGLNTGMGLFYEGTEPNFERDRFALLSEMEEAGKARKLDVGHISYVTEKGMHYVWDGMTCEPLVTPSTGGGGSSVTKYYGGAGISVSGESISFIYGTALGLKETDKSIGLMFDQRYFGINEYGPDYDPLRAGLTLKISTNSGLEVLSSGEPKEHGLKVKHDESLELYKGELGVRVSTNLKITGAGIGIKLGTNTEREVYNGLRNSSVHGLGVAAGEGLGFDSNDKLVLSVNKNVDARSFSPLFFNSSGQLDLRLSYADFSYDQKSQNIIVNPEIFSRATSKINLGTGLFYDTKNDMIDFHTSRPLVVDGGTVSLQYGTGLYVEDGKLCARASEGTALSAGAGVDIQNGIIDVNLHGTSVFNAADDGRGYSGLGFDATTKQLGVRVAKDKGLKTSKDGLYVLLSEETTYRNGNSSIAKYGNAIVQGGTGIRLKLSTGLAIDPEGYLYVDTSAFSPLNPLNETAEA